jgi:hypothetical protein
MRNDVDGIDVSGKNEEALERFVVEIALKRK